MSALAALVERAPEAGLFVAGVAPLGLQDGLPPRFRAVALLSPDEPGFWPLFAASPEAGDGARHPLDRWSRRVIGGLACALGTKAVFPFTGPPWRPFTAWARRSGRAWPSPVGLLVHDTSGLWISFRGGVLLEEAPPSAPGRNPCETCAGKPCLTACPVGALGPLAYDVALCHAYLDSAPDCRQGCHVRRACPVGAGRRAPEQSEFHMRAFRGT